jgi:hypothetical protein
MVEEGRKEDITDRHTQFLQTKRHHLIKPLFRAFSNINHSPFTIYIFSLAIPKIYRIFTLYGEEGCS